MPSSHSTYSQILLIWKMGSQILVKNIICHAEYPSHGQLISVFSGKVLDSHHGFHTEPPFSTSILFLFSSQFSSASISFKTQGCCIGVTTSFNRTVNYAGYYTNLLPSLENLHWVIDRHTTKTLMTLCIYIFRHSSLEMQRTVHFIFTFVLHSLGHPNRNDIVKNFRNICII